MKPAETKPAPAGTSILLDISTIYLNDIEPTASTFSLPTDDKTKEGAGRSTFVPSSFFLQMIDGSADPVVAAVSVPPPSVLRGKTIEEIVNRWSSDLDNHVRDFNTFASEVAAWDRALIGNGNNVSTPSDSTSFIPLTLEIAGCAIQYGFGGGTRAERH